MVYPNATEQTTAALLHEFMFEHAVLHLLVQRTPAHHSALPEPLLGAAGPLQAAAACSAQAATKVVVSMTQSLAGN